MSSTQTPSINYCSLLELPFDAMELIFQFSQIEDVIRSSYSDRYLCNAVYTYVTKKFNLSYQNYLSLLSNNHQESSVPDEWTSRMLTKRRFRWWDAHDEKFESSKRITLLKDLALTCIRAVRVSTLKKLLDLFPKKLMIEVFRTVMIHVIRIDSSKKRMKRMKLLFKLSQGKLRFIDLVGKWEESTSLVLNKNRTSGNKSKYIRKKVKHFEPLYYLKICLKKKKLPLASYIYSEGAKSPIIMKQMIDSLVFEELESNDIFLLEKIKKDQDRARKAEAIRYIIGGLLDRFFGVCDVELSVRVFKNLLKVLCPNYIQRLRRTGQSVVFSGYMFKRSHSDMVVMENKYVSKKKIVKLSGFF